ncbi:MAG: HD domain-containing phosphohydrolase [Acidobacteriota bacterium]
MASPLTDICGETLYSLSWQYAQDGKIVVDLALGVVADANPAMEELMGYSRAELIGMPLSQLHPDCEQNRVGIEIEEKRKSAQAMVHQDFHIQRKDGRVVPVQIWCSDLVKLDGRTFEVAEFRDITARLRDRRQAAAQNWALSAFSAAALALGKARSEEDLLQSICEAITYESAYPLAYVSVAEENADKDIRFHGASGKAVDYLRGLHLSWAEGSLERQGPSAVCIRSHQLYQEDDLDNATNFALWRERAREFGLRSMIAVPLSIEGSWRGALVVFSGDSGVFEAEPVQVFQRLGEQIVHGILSLRHKELLEAERLNLERSQRRLTEALTASVSAMVTAMETRDPYTAGHESRVAELVVAIGREMGLDEEKLQGMRLAAMVHDIGKIGVPSEILTKPTRLSRAEFELVKAHPETGYTILKDVPFPWPVADMVRQHHEKLDGSGYPLGLHSGDLLLESKIMAVADIVEAMASDRPYRPSLGLEAALAEVERMAGKQLDPDVVCACASLLRERRLILPGLNWR